MITVLSALVLSQIAPANMSSDTGRLAGPGMACPQMTTSNLSVDESAAAQRVLTDVCAIFGSAAFTKAVEAQDKWSAGCGRFPYTKTRRVESDEILRRIRADIPAFTLIKGKPRGAIAVADASNRTIKIEPVRIASAANGNGDSAAALVNTLSHEMTHLITANNQPGGSYFTDRGQGWITFWCKRSQMVSYRTQDIVEDIWREGRGGS